MPVVKWMLAVLVFLPVTFAQAQPLPIFRGGVDLLEVDVNVVDDDGTPVADLIGSDFIVSVDGAPRPVVSAQFVDLRMTGLSSPEAGAAQPDLFYTTNITATRGRVIVVAVDRENIGWGEGRRIMAAAMDFLDTLGPNDKVAFVTVPPPGPYVDFTADHQLVRAALENTVGIGNEITFWSDQFRIGVAEALEINRSQGRSALAIVAIRRLCGTEPEESECESEVVNNAYIISNEVHRQAELSVTMLEGILDGLSQIEGPKSLIWISEGLTTETGVELSGLVSRASGARTTVHVIMLDTIARLDMTQDGPGPSERLDRNMAEMGLHALASFTGGTLQRVISHAEPAFERIERELSGYYLLGVEPLPEDLDGDFHEIDVSVRRRGVTVRGHREFRHRPVDEISTDIEDRLRRTVSSPIAVSDLPLRVATYTYKDPASANTRVLVVTDVERDMFGPADVMFGYQLTRSDGKVAAGGTQRATIEAVDGPQGPVLEQLAWFVVEPGQYRLKLGVVENGGRRGSLEHPVDARQMSGQRFAMGDLVLVTAPADATARVRPPVETRVTDDQLMAYLELYTDDSVDLADVRVQIEVDSDTLDEVLVVEVGEPSGSDGEAARLANLDGFLRVPFVSDPRRVVSAVIGVDLLPEGSYVARAIVTRGGEELGRRTRPFEIERDPNRLAAGGGEPVGDSVVVSVVDFETEAALSMMLSEPAEFQRDTVLAPEVIGFFLDVVDREFPNLAATTARMRIGEFDGVADSVFASDDTVGAAFLGGLESFADGDLERASTQFLIAEVGFAPAAFYLGAVHAAAGRDDEAVLAWHRALLADDIAPVEYAVLCDANVRLGNVDQAVPVLHEALVMWPNDDPIRRCLAIAQAISGQHGAALDTVEPYLVRHPSDHEALLLAVYSIYAYYEIGGLFVTSQDRARMAKYAEAYAMSEGPNQAIVSIWAGSVTSAP